jgi:hypothetical protein
MLAIGIKPMTTAKNILIPFLFARNAISSKNGSVNMSSGTKARKAGVCECTVIDSFIRKSEGGKDDNDFLG